MGFGIGDLRLGFGIRDWDFGNREWRLEIGIGIEDLDWGLILWIGIGDLGFGIGDWDLDWD